MAGDMADNELQGFEEITGGDTDADDAGGGFDTNLDDIFNTGDGDDSGGGMDAFDSGMGDEAGSSLDSFFDDLSTIDDLEVLQDDAGDSSGADSDIEVGAPKVAEDEGEEESVAAEPVKKKEKKAQPSGEPGFIRRWFFRIIVLLVLGVGGFFFYTTVGEKLPEYWGVVPEGIDEGMKIVKGWMGSDGKVTPPKKTVMKALPKKPEPLPIVTTKRASAPQMPRIKAPPRPKPESGPWSIQVATCFFPSCVKGYNNYLKANKRSVLLLEKSSRSQSLEIFSISKFSRQEDARQIAQRINGSHPLEGHAYSYREKDAYRISMGVFQDLARTKVVTSALNRQFAGEILFSTRSKEFPYRVKAVLTGKFPSRQSAASALARLHNQDPRFKGAFVVKRRK